MEASTYLWFREALEECGFTDIVYMPDGTISCRKGKKKYEGVFPSSLTCFTTKESPIQSKFSLTID